MKTKRIISMLLMLCIVLGSMAGLCVSASAETITSTIYSGSGATQSATDSTIYSLYSGERLSGANGEKYTITYVGKSYTNVDGYDLTLCDGDTKVKLYWKRTNEYDGTVDGQGAAINYGTSNPFNVKAVIDVDFSQSPATAAVKVYDHDLTTALVDKTVTLTGLTGISDIIYDVWSGGNLNFAKPVSPTLKIETTSEVNWEMIYAKTLVKDSSSATNYIYNGDLSLTQGNMYRVTWEGTWYHGGIDSSEFRLSDADSDMMLFWKAGDKNAPIGTPTGSTIAYTATDTNPKPFKFVMLFDYLGSTPNATINVYDIDGTTLAGSYSVDLTGIDSIKSLYFKAGGTNISYTVPHTGKVNIEKASFGAAEAVSLETIDITSGTQSNHGTETTQYLDLYSGNLSTVNDEKYYIRWNTRFYKGGGVSNGDFVLADDDSTVTLFSKDKDANTITGESITFATLADTANPDPIAVDITLDFKWDIAKVDFYDDTAATMLLGTKYVSLAGLDAVKSIYYRVAEVATIYGWPQSVSGTDSFVVRRAAGTGATTWKQLYTGDQTKSGFEAVVFEGNIPVEAGDKYKLTWEGNWYLGGIAGGNFYLADSDSEVALFFKGNSITDSKGNASNKINNAFEYTFASPTDYKFVIYLDINATAPKAIVDVYDSDKQTLIGTATADLSGIDSIQKIYYKTWDENTSNLSYTLPRSSTLTIAQDVATMTIVESKTLTSAAESSGTIAVDVEIVAADKAVPYALIAAYYSGSKLVYVDVEADTVAAYDTLEDHTFTVPTSIVGNYDNAVIYLWKSMESIEPYAASVPVEK